MMLHGYANSTSMNECGGMTYERDAPVAAFMDASARRRISTRPSGGGKRHSSEMRPS